MNQLTKKNGNSSPTLLSEVENFFSRDIFDFDRPLFPFRSTANVPSVNIKESKDAFIIEVAAPGLKKNNFKLEVDNNNLLISAEKEEETKEENENYYCREFSYQSFNRSFRLPENANPEKIKAVYEDGVLKLNLPKKKIAKNEERKSISID